MLFTAQEHWLEQLRTDGFVRLALHDDTHRQLVQRVLQHTSGFSSFRFPPIEGEVKYTPDIRSVFALLYSISRRVLMEVLQSLSNSPEVLRLTRCLNRSENEVLFVDSHAPFCGDEDFSGTFFNLFHYDHGCLNTHKDRYLITVVAILPAQSLESESEELQHSALWVRSSKGQWQNVDTIVQEGEIVVFVGEEIQRIGSEVGEKFQACDHCIRVDPEGEYIPHSHHQRDPQSLSVGNRCSIALVLGEKDG